MTLPLRRIPFKKISNFRDVGGYPTKEGEILAYGRLYRSSIFSDEKITDVAMFESLGIDGIIDLRSPREVASEPDVFKEKVRFYEAINLSNAVNAGRSSELAQQATDEFFMADRYLEYLESTAAVKAFFDILLAHPDTTIVYHCSAGKDRTGLLTYLLLGLHGVSLSDITADYQVSYTYIKNDPKVIKKKNTLNIYRSHPEIIERLHDQFINRYSSFESYFTLLGYSEEDILQLKYYLVSSKKQKI